MLKRQSILRLWCMTAALSLMPCGMYATDTSAPQTQASKVSGPVTKIVGTVIDEIGEGVPGAVIKVKGDSRGVMTGVDGSFTMDVAPGSVIEVSFLGYSPQTLTVGKDTDYTIKLTPLSNELDEVVAVAYGKQKKESVVGAISTIDASMLKVPVSNLSSAIAGKIAGAVVMQRSAEPGTSADFWIRGISSFGANNRPLVLVDGVERSMDLVDPEDIQTFSILKDATATALYGVRGANGIVLITTKRGSESKPKVSAKVEYGFTNAVKLPELASGEQWLKYYNDIQLDAGGAIIQPLEVAKYLDGSDPDLYPNVDWMKTIFKDYATTVRANVSVSGGTDKVRYYMGGSVYSESSIFNIQDNSRYDAQMRYTKYNFRANVDVNITRTTEVGLSISTLYSTRNRPGYSLQEIYNWVLLTTPVSTTPVFSDGTPARPKNGWNPYYMLNSTGYSQDFSTSTQSLVSLTQDFSDIITPGLKANIKFAWDAYTASTIDRTMSPTTYYVDVAADGGRDEDGNLILHELEPGTDYLQLGRSNSGNRNTNFEAAVTYDRVFKDVHHVSGMFNFNMREYTNNFPYSFIDGISNRNTGIAGRATYSFDNRYFAEFNFGYNGSENFAPKHRFGFFPSYALGYIISNEKFWEHITPVISLLKLKASYGEIGNDQIGGNRRFAFNTEMQSGVKGYIWGLESHLSPNYSGIATGVPGNENVSWEKAIKKNIGFELGFFNSSLTLNADYFYEKRSGIFIMQQSIPSVVGNNVTQYVNLGKMKNQGIDATLEYNKMLGDVFLSARGTFTYNRNNLIDNDKPSQVWPYQNEAGFAYLQQRGLIALGLFESEEDIARSPVQTFGGEVRPGDIKYKDINGDGVIDAYDRVAIGYTYIPEINYGFGVSASWKGIDVSVFFQGVGHITRLLSSPSFYGQSENLWAKGQIYAEVAENRWTIDNPDPNAMFPRLSLTKVANNQEASTYWQRDCSFIRLKNAEIGYTFPKKWFEKAGISNVRVYVTGNNLLTFSKFKLWDPELESNSGAKYPQMRTGAVGLNVNF
ncbi:MAG: TonB-dependent receptor [Muribaculaceae bacterium]|nr:TonB-dependent receptor [Muribaculaceae bacterium]